MSRSGEEHSAPMSRSGEEHSAGRIVVVGIGADGPDGLSRQSHRELERASVVFGSLRQLELLAAEPLTADCRVWPSPLLSSLPTLFDGPGDVHVLASGDPMLHGIGTTLVRLFGADRVTVLPHVSSVSLACARMGWAVGDPEVISLVTAPVAAAVRGGGHAVVLSRDAATPAALARTLTGHGLGASRLTVLSQLGAADERRVTGIANRWDHAPGDSLNVVAVEYVPDDPVQPLPLVPGLPDGIFSHDGQLTKRHIRALTLSSLSPRPGQRLWDVGAGSGSIGLEWVRCGSGCTAVAFERNAARRAAVAVNAGTLGVDVGIGVALEIRGLVPDDFDGAGTPDAIFVGGGVTQPGLLDACWERLPPGGRIIVNAVTAESEALLVQWHSHRGGALHRYRIEDAEPLGTFTSWRSRLPVAQWVGYKP